MSKSKKLKKSFILGVASLTVFAVGVSASFASIPKRVTNDTLIYDQLSEIKVRRQKEIAFDRDIANLARLEGRYQAKVPSKSSPIKTIEYKRSDRIKAPMKRISYKPYKKSHKSKKSLKRNFNRSKRR